MGFLDGTHPSPPQPTHPANKTDIYAFSNWFRQDQLLLNGILASVADSITPLIASAKTSRDAWLRLNRLYANKSRSRVMQLKEHLTLLQRGDKLIATYLQEVKSTIDELAIIDTPCPPMTSPFMFFVALVLTTVIWLPLSALVKLLSLLRNCMIS